MADHADAGALLALAGTVVAASDGFFAARENLIRPEMPDGRRERSGPSGPDAHEWAVVRLASRAAVAAAEIDTSGSGQAGEGPRAASLTARDGESGWSVLLASAPLRPGTRHRFQLPAPVTATHVRLNLFPGGGVARVRLFGTRA